MNIRLLNENDGKLLQSIRLEALQSVPSAFGSSYEEEIKCETSVYTERLKSRYNYYYGAFDNDKIIGIICISAHNRLKTLHRATITSVYVNANYRDQGIGKKLLSSVIKKANEIDDIEQVELTVVTDQHQAISLYKSMGFEIYAHEYHSLKYNGIYYDEYYMMLKK